MNLRENASWSGSDMSLFHKAITELTDATNFTVYHPNQILLMTVDKKKVDAYGSDPIPFNLYDYTGKKIPKVISRESLAEKDIPDYLIDELLEDQNLLLLLIKDKTFSKGKLCVFTDQDFAKDLCGRVEMTGDGSTVQMILPNDGTSPRDALVSMNLHMNPKFNNKEIGIVTRRDGRAIKAFAARSGSYQYVPQTVLLDIIKKISDPKYGLGEMKVIGWEINRKFTSIDIEFPEFADDICATYGLPEVFTPRIHLSTSDTGDNGVTCVGYWSFRGCVVKQEGEGYNRKHRGEISVEEIVVNTDKKVFATYRKTPERLAELLTIEVNDPCAAIHKALKDIGVTSSNFGKKLPVELEEALCAEIDTTRKYNAYDLSTMILTIPERISGISDTYAKKLAGLVSDVISVEWEKIKSASHSKVALAS